MQVADLVSKGFGVVVCAVLAGYGMKKAGWADSLLARTLMVWIQRYVMPPILFVSFWGMDFKRFSLILLPLLGIAVILFQYTLAYLACRIFRIEGSKRGTFLIGAILSNVGYIGWPLNLALFGKTGFDYSFLYCFYFTFAVYFLAYPLAARYSDHDAMRNESFLKKVTVEGIIVVIALAIFLGILFNILKVPLNPILPKINSLMIFAATLTVMTAVGWTLRVRSFWPYLSLSFLMILIKLVLTPVTTASLLMPLQDMLMLDPLMVKVVVIQSMMPLAISCLSVSVIFGLDQDFMNTLWITTTFCFFALMGVIISVSY